jgi:ABC-2 type transport system permease protein
MNTQSNAMPESLEPQKVTAAAIPLTRRLLWSVRRELWESRFVYVAPLAVAAVFLLGFLISIVHLPAKVRASSALDPMHFRNVVAIPYDFAAGLMMLTTIVVSLFYCLDALHSERRDRSLLFWKSLPVSDTGTVLAKACVPFVILPVLATALGSALHLIMLALSSAVLWGSGQSAAALWRDLPWFRMSLLLFYHIVTAHTLWPAPIYAWLLLVSGWARRAAFLWATLPVIAITALEQLVFHSWHFAILVGTRLIGGGPETTIAPPNVFPTNPMAHVMPGMFLADPGLWLGLAVSAVFLALAVRLRRSAGPI